MLFNWCDWLLLAFLLVAAAGGFRRGAIREIGGLAAYVAGVMVAVVYSPSLAQYLVRAFPVLADRLAMWLVGTAAAGGNLANNPLSSSPLAGLFDLGLPAGSLFGQWLSRGFMTVVAFIILFLVAVALVRWLSSMVSAGFNRTPLGLVNRLLGLVAGGSVGALTMGMVLSLLTFFIKLGGPAGSEGPLQSAVNHSVLAPHLMQLFAWAAIQLRLLLTAP